MNVTLYFNCDQQTYHPVNTTADARKTELEQAVAVH